jgi:hypothetical protein
MAITPATHGVFGLIDRRPMARMSRMRNFRIIIGLQNSTIKNADVSEK